MNLFGHYTIKSACMSRLTAEENANKEPFSPNRVEILVKEAKVSCRPELRAAYICLDYSRSSYKHTSCLALIEECVS